jgi:hypothetical protein
MSNPFVELAKMLKERENPKLIGVIIGAVEKAPPELEVRVNSKILLKKHQIVIGEEKVKGYQRKFEVTFDEQSMTVSGSNMSLAGSGPHKHNLLSWMGNGTGTGTIQWTDELKEGDKVILVPTNEHNIFFLMDKAYKY